MKSFVTANSMLRFGIFLLCLAAVGPAVAQAPTFEITLAVSESWTDNPAYVAGLDDSDVVNSFSLDVPYRRERQNHTWSFLYSPTYRQHSEFSDLDYLEHLLTTSLVGTPSPKSSFQVDLSYLNSQSQDISEEFVTEPVFLTNRTERESITANVQFDREIKPRWRLTGSVRGRTLTIEEVSGFDSGVMPDQLGDQVSTAIGAGASYEKSQQTAIDFGYSLRGYNLDLSEDETIHSVYAGATHIISPTMTVGYGGGIGTRDGTGGGETTFEAHGSISQQFKRGSLTADADRSARNGDAVAGGSTVSGIGVRYSEVLGRRTQWNTSARWSVREAEASGEEDVELLRGSVAVTVRGPRFEQGRLNEGLGLRFRGSIVDQSGAEEDVFNSSYYVVTAALLAFFSN